eukprot:GHVT01097495.1.p1 GENE.GHVT01097495.1~~GHVT01097495.1.p1  ORF type:complete len:279 (-),score=22.90 GHVT01097495.1:112-948(-)
MRRIQTQTSFAQQKTTPPQSSPTITLVLTKYLGYQIVSAVTLPLTPYAGPHQARLISRHPQNKLGNSITSTFYSAFETAEDRLWPVTLLHLIWPFFCSNHECGGNCRFILFGDCRCVDADTGALHISGRLKAFADGECVGASGSWRKRRKAATEISATADGSYSCSQSFTSCSSSAASRAVPRHSQVPMEVRTSSLGGKPLYADDRSPAPPTASPCPDGSELQPPSRRHHGRRSADRHCSVRGHEKAVNALPPKLLGSRRYRARRAAGLLAGSLPISG